MAENTKIEWAHHTFNPWEGCQKVGPGCDHCYAETRNARFAGGQAINWGPGAPRRRTSASNWQQPLKWNAEAERLGIRYRVFCASLADVFDNEVDPQWREDLFKLIQQTPNLDWLLLTKRIGNVATMAREAMLYSLQMTVDQPLRLPPNIWLGATIVNQAEADRDIPKLLAVPAARRFLSMEPLLGPVDLVKSKAVRSMCKTCADGQSKGCILDQPGPFIDWVIVGGESGPGARECHVGHIRNIVQQCKAAGVPVFVKQLGAQPRGWCAANVHIEPSEAAELDADHCDFYEAGESRACSGRCVVFEDKKCGNPAEWPEDLRVREVPNG